MDSQTFYTRYNGGYYFFVEIYPSHFLATKLDDGETRYFEYTDMFKTDHAILFKRKTKGDGHVYTYICQELFTFRIPTIIVRFIAPLGNADVPYPVAVDNDGTNYLLLQRVKGGGHAETAYNRYYAPTGHYRPGKNNRDTKNFKSFAIYGLWK